MKEESKYTYERAETWFIAQMKDMEEYYPTSQKRRFTFEELRQKYNKPTQIRRIHEI